MKLRKYRSEDCPELASLFYETVHWVNTGDYSKEQVDAWATGKVHICEWDRIFLNHTTIIAEEDGMIVGFGNMDASGYIDKLYVHKDYQGRKIASAILKRLENKSKSLGVREFSTHASITAKPFFEKTDIEWYLEIQ